MGIVIVFDPHLGWKSSILYRLQGVWTVKKNVFLQLCLWRTGTQRFYCELISERSSTHSDKGNKKIPSSPTFGPKVVRMCWKDLLKLPKIQQPNNWLSEEGGVFLFLRVITKCPLHFVGTFPFTQSTPHTHLHSLEYSGMRRPFWDASVAFASHNMPRSNLALQSPKTTVVYHCFILL